MIEEIVRAKPSGAKGKYIRSATLTTTMGPGVKVDSGKAGDSGPAPAKAATAEPEEPAEVDAPPTEEPEAAAEAESAEEPATA